MVWNSEELDHQPMCINVRVGEGLSSRKPDKKGMSNGPPPRHAIVSVTAGSESGQLMY